MTDLKYLEVLVCGQPEGVAANGCGMDNVIRTLNMIINKEEGQEPSNIRKALALEYGTLRELIERDGLDIVKNTINDLVEELGMKDGRKPEESHTYTVLRVTYTHLSDKGCIKWDRTYVPWSLKDGKEIYLKGTEYTSNIIKLA